jgi:hypothetical protein
MSVLVLDRPCSDGPRHGGGAALEDDRPWTDAPAAGPSDGHDLITLDDLIADAWEGLAACSSVSCPACGGAMKSLSALEAGAHDGACEDCGAWLT